MRYVEKYCRAGQATCDSMMHVHCVLGIEGYKYMLRISNAYWSFHCNSGCMSARQCYVIHALPVLSLMYSVFLNIR
jgi:hypothetical protein